MRSETPTVAFGGGPQMPGLHLICKPRDGELETEKGLKIILAKFAF